MGSAFRNSRPANKLVALHSGRGASGFLPQLLGPCYALLKRSGGERFHMTAKFFDQVGRIKCARMAVQAFSASGSDSKGEPPTFMADRL
jgi:hypothetical protein